MKPATSAQTPKAADPAQAQKSPAAAAPASAADAKTDMKTPTAAGAAEIKNTGETNKAVAPASGTTGTGAASASRLSTEQRTQLTRVIRQQKVQPVTLSVSIAVGTRVPRNVRYYPLPGEVVTIYPQWRGYDYILVGSQALVLDPRTHEIVAILDA